MCASPPAVPTDSSSAAPMTVIACSAASLPAALRRCLALRCSRFMPPLLWLLPNPFTLISGCIHDAKMSSACTANPVKTMQEHEDVKHLAAISRMQACQCYKPSTKSCMHKLLMTRHLQSVHNLRQVLLIGHDLRQVLVRLQRHAQNALSKVGSRHRRHQPCIATIAATVLCTWGASSRTASTASHTIPCIAVSKSACEFTLPDCGFTNYAPSETFNIVH